MGFGPVVSVDAVSRDPVGLRISGRDGTLADSGHVGVGRAGFGQQFLHPVRERRGRCPG